MKLSYGLPPKRRLAFYGALFGGLGAWLVWLNWLPGKSWAGPIGSPNAALQTRLEHDVTFLAVDIGERNIDHPEALAAAQTFVEDELRGAKLSVTTQSFEARRHTVANVVGEKKGTGRADEIVVIGAHYDSVIGSTGADDNGSGVAALLAIARALEGESFPRTLRFVAFVNEEPPYFQHDTMGSLVYANECRAKNENVVHMMSLETLGYFSDARGSQKYPVGLGLFYPTTGNFLGFVGNPSSRADVRAAVGSFRSVAQLPSEGAVLPPFLPGIGWSDQWAFWQAGYPGVMVTDTAPFRNPSYHTDRDLPPSMDFGRMALAVEGLVEVVKGFAR